MMADNDSRGKLRVFKEYRVYCADCGREEVLGKTRRADAERKLREKGWRERAYGWFCPEDNGNALPGQYWKNCAW